MTKPGATATDLKQVLKKQTCLEGNEIFVQEAKKRIKELEAEQPITSEMKKKGVVTAVSLSEAVKKQMLLGVLDENNSVVKEARKRIKELEAKEKAAAALQEAAASKDMDKLKVAIQQAKDVGVEAAKIEEAESLLKVEEAKAKAKAEEAIRDEMKRTGVTSDSLSEVVEKQIPHGGLKESDGVVQEAKKKIEDLEIAESEASAKDTTAPIFKAPFLKVIENLMITYTFTDGRDLDTDTQLLHPETKQIIGIVGRKGAEVIGRRTGEKILTFGGDNTGTGKEAVIFNRAAWEKNYPECKDFALLNCSAYWFGEIGRNPAVLRCTGWLGGAMQKDGYTWTNTSAEKTWDGFKEFGRVISTKNSTRISYLHIDFKKGMLVFSDTPEKSVAK
jgi:hypothetical protein